ncbi:MAG: hypothetical protein J6B02_02345 [Selenomonadales bacterium]|nr:hypothetical protein [Selenomonadales bacterium]
MEISVDEAEREQEKRLILVLAQVAGEVGEEETGEACRRVLPRVDGLE